MIETRTSAQGCLNWKKLQNAIDALMMNSHDPARLWQWLDETDGDLAL